MSIAYDGGQKVHSGGGATRRDDTPRDWTPDERAAHAKNTASNVTRAAAEVAAACARMQAATEFTEQAAAKKEAGLALESLRAAATAAAAAVSQATDPEVVVVLQGADAQLKAADAEVKALPEPIATSPREVTGVRRFATALPPADGPGRQDSPRMVAQLRGIIASELVHGDLDPLKAALAEGGELWPQFSRLAMQLRAELLGKLDTERPRLLTERIDRETAAKRRSVGSVPVEAVADPAAPAHDGPAAENSPGADVHDPLHALAATASAQLGIAPRLEVGEAGRAATEARGARGVAHGDAIAIHPDVDPATPAGKQVVFHEHLHQAQSQLPAEQDAGRAAAELEADELASAAANGGALTRPTRHIDLSRPAGDDDAKRARDQGPHSEAAEARVDAALAAAARDGQTVTSRVYLRGHLSERVLPAIARFLADKRYPLPERLRYIDSDRGVGAEAVRLITEVHGGDPYYALPQILERVGVDVWAIIDAHRKAPAPRTFGDVVGGAAPTDSTDLSTGKRGGPGWVDGIGTGIAEGFHRAVSESVTRLGERYVAAFDSNGKDAAESHGLRTNLAVAYHHLSPVVAIDRLVGRVMVDDLVRVEPAPAAKPAPAKDKPGDEPTAAPRTVTSAAQRVAEDALQVEMALGLDRRGPGGLHMPPKEIHALRHALDDLAGTLHDHARQDRDEVKELDVARAKVEAVQRQLVGRYGARNAEVSSLARAVGRVWAAARANQATDAPDTQDERDGLASVARETLAMLEGARSMIEQAQGQVPGVYVFSKPIMPAITTTRQWVTELDGGQDAAAAMRLATAIRSQEQFVATVVAELTAVFAEPPTATWAATVNAYAEVLGQSSLPPDHSAPALEQARRMRRRLKLDVAAAFIDGGNEAAGQVRELDGQEGAAATAEQRALIARRDQYEEQIAAGGVVSQAALDDLALDAREQAFDHRLEVLDQMAKKVRGAAADLQELHVTRGLAVWALQKHILAGVVPKCDALVRSLAEVERTTLAARTKAGKAASPDKGNALRTAAADAAEVQLKTALRDGHYQATLDEARSKLDDAQLVDTIAMLAELIAMTLVGNLAATATSGMARGMVMARASANAERAAAAMEAAGTARQLALAEQAGTMLRAEGLAARIGGAAGMAAEGVVNSLGQKYLQGDDSSLASLIVVNIGTSAALERLVGALATVRHAEQAGADAIAEVRKLRLAARKGGAMAKAAATLGAEVVMAAAVDHALSKMVGRASNPPSDQTVAEWLMQGAMMAVGKHMSRNVDAIAHSLEALDLKATGAGADIYARAKGLATRSHEFAAGEGAGHSADVLEQYIQLLADQTRLLNQEMVESVDHGDDKRRAQIVKALRDANRASGQVRDFAQDSIDGATADGTPDRPAGAKPERAAGDDKPARDEEAPSNRTQATRGEGADEEAPLPRTSPDRSVLDAMYKAGYEWDPLANRWVPGEKLAPTVDPPTRDLDRITNGPDGVIRDEAQLNNADVAYAMNEQLQAVKPSQVGGIIDRFSPDQQAKARVVLAKASGYGNMESLNGLRAAMEPQLSAGLRLYTPGHGSLGDNIGYLASKNKHTFPQHPENIKTTDKILPDKTLVIVDDVILHKIKTEPGFAQELLDANAFLLEARGFNSGINMYNATSPEVIAQRTSELLGRANDIQAKSNGNLDFDQAVNSALDEVTQQTLAAASPDLAASVKRVDAASHPDVTDAAIAGQLNGKAGISEAQVDAVMASVPEKFRGMLRELMARQAQVFSPRSQSNEILLGDQRARGIAAAKGIDPNNIYYYIPKSNKSYGILAMAHREATGTPVDRYINGPGELSKVGPGRDKLIVVLDDVAGSGESLQFATETSSKPKPENARAAGFEGEIVVVPIRSTEIADKRFTGPGGFESKDPHLEYSPNEVSKALKESDFYKGLDDIKRKQLEQLLTDLGFDENGLSMAFPYMAPDNNNMFFGDQIAKFFIMNEARDASKTGRGWKAPRR